MIDFERDIKITLKDIEIQNRLRRERRPLSMDEYLAFLKFSQELFGPAEPASPPRVPKNAKFQFPNPDFRAGTGACPYTGND